MRLRLFFPRVREKKPKNFQNTLDNVQEQGYIVQALNSALPEVAA
jgi:hypothetical protein